MIRKPAAFIVPLLLCGCVTETVGDFGRRQESVFNDTIMAGAGTFATQGDREAGSSFPMTDDESALRNVAWDLVKPPGAIASWDSHYNRNVQWTRSAPAQWYGDGVNDFYLVMRNGGLASHETYYQLLIDQARSDASRLPTFRDVATRVGKADAARRGALNALYADEAMRGEAQARINENGRIVAWVEDSMQYRISAYRAALGRLMVEMPSPKAVDAEASIDALQWEVNGSLGAMRVRHYGDGRAKPVRPFRPHSGKRKA